ncbi:hypothetical protein [Arsenophonus nasoniae]|uniref:Uncharacterized protein n=1 Tax=Arsenophonus nasoniae TaxID=638 RepID=A0A4P7L7Y5_9GAMM|nr:hypothetical protein [Arsenophonus nasoniae]QBY46384.1 hypothetical protein ArsFIN_49950 [Arsenophonus nasoniae]
MVNDLPDYEILFDPVTDKVTFKIESNTDKADASRKREKGKKEIYKIKNVDEKMNL